MTRLVSCVLCAGAEPSDTSPLQRLLPPGRSRFIAETRRLVAVPTFGCFVAGYLPNRPEQRIRLRRLVADLDPRTNSAGWDWADRNYPELIRQTVDDLGPSAAVDGACR